MPIDEKLLDLSQYDYTTFDPHCLKANGVRRVIFGSFPEMMIADMARRAVDAGLRVEGFYGLIYFGDQPYYVRRDTEAACRLAKRFGAKWVWLDCEADAADIGVPSRTPLPTERIRQIQQMVDYVRSQGLNPGIYTGRWWWVPRVNNTTAFSSLPLWHAEYPTVPRPIQYVDYGGWRRVAIHQYSSEIIVCGRRRDHNYVFDPFALTYNDAIGETEMATAKEILEEARRNKAFRDELVAMIKQDLPIHYAMDSRAAMALVAAVMDELRKAFTESLRREIGTDVASDPVRWIGFVTRRLDMVHDAAEKAARTGNCGEAWREIERALNFRIPPEPVD